MSREDFMDAYWGHRKQAAWASCIRADWMYAVKLADAADSKQAQARLVRSLSSQLAEEAKVQSFECADACATIERWARDRENRDEVQQVIGKMSEASYDAILEEGAPDKAALCEAFAKLGAVCEILMADEGLLEDACSYLAEATECLATSQALHKSDNDDPTEALEALAGEIRFSFATPLH